MNQPSPHPHPLIHTSPPLSELTMSSRCCPRLTCGGALQLFLLLLAAAAAARVPHASIALRRRRNGARDGGGGVGKDCSTVAPPTRKVQWHSRVVSQEGCGRRSQTASGVRRQAGVSSAEHRSGCGCGCECGDGGGRNTVGGHEYTGWFSSDRIAWVCGGGGRHVTVTYFQDAGPYHIWNTNNVTANAATSTLNSGNTVATNESKLKNLCVSTPVCCSRGKQCAIYTRHNTHTPTLARALYPNAR